MRPHPCPGPTTNVAALAVLLALAATGVGCAPSDQEAGYHAKRALLVRQNQGIRELVQEAEKGTLLPEDRFLIGVDESIVADLLRAELPLERPIGKRFVVRLESAQVHFRDKYGEIVLEGNAFRPETADRRTAVRVHGGLGAVVIDPATDLLTIAIAIDDLEILQAGILENVLGRGGKKLLAQTAKEKLGDALPKIRVPVGLAHDVRVPSIREGALQLDSLRIPLDLSVERVIAARQKLWITLDAKVGEIAGAEEGLGVSVGKKKKSATGGKP
jgi:hypothetical protein